MTLPTGITLDKVMDAGLAAMPLSEWHTEKEENWHWHASGLANCPRQLILQRAHGHVDPRSKRSTMTLLLGTLWHSQFEHWLKDYQSVTPGMEIVVQEVGFYHPTLTLAAKPDALVSVNGRNVLVDFKTEHTCGPNCPADARKWRRKDAEKAGEASTAKPDHQLQLVATAMVLEANGYRVDDGRIWYMSKSHGIGDEQVVDVKSSMLRNRVTYLCNELDRLWKSYQAGGHLPKRLAPDAWQCRASKVDNKSGEYCSVRSICMHPNSPS